LEFYTIISGRERKPHRNAELHEAAQALAGVAFSLRRTVFLNHPTGDYEDQLAALEKFLIGLRSAVDSKVSVMPRTGRGRLDLLP
jgi:hypothetical protein